MTLRSNRPAEIATCAASSGGKLPRISAQRTPGKRDMTKYATRSASSSLPETCTVGTGTPCRLPAIRSAAASTAARSATGAGNIFNTKRRPVELRIPTT